MTRGGPFPLRFFRIDHAVEISIRPGGEGTVYREEPEI